LSTTRRQLRETRGGAPRRRKTCMAARASLAYLTAPPLNPAQNVLRLIDQERRKGRQFPFVCGKPRRSFKKKTEKEEATGNEAKKQSLRWGEEREELSSAPTTWNPTPKRSLPADGLRSRAERARHELRSASQCPSPARQPKPPPSRPLQPCLP
jgi:hypothetical protein